MTVQVDLLPVEYKLKAKRPRRFKVWVALSMAVAVAQGMSSMFLRLQADEARRALQETKEMQDEKRTLIEDLASLTAQERAVARQVALNEGLRRKHRWSRAFAELSAQLPDKVLLTKLASNPPRNVDLGGGRNETERRVRQLRGAANPDGQAGTARGLFIDGIATDHESVAGLLGALDDHAGFGVCELKSTSRQPFMDDYAVAFMIHTRW